MASVPDGRWSIDDDVVQAIRAETQRMIRNRKGSTPKIMLLIMDHSVPALLSLRCAGAIDCSYHAAVDDLIETVKGSNGETEK